MHKKAYRSTRCVAGQEQALRFLTWTKNEKKQSTTMVLANELLARPSPMHRTPAMVWHDHSHQRRPRMPYLLAKKSEIMPPATGADVSGLWCSTLHLLVCTRVSPDHPKCQPRQAMTCFAQSCAGMIVHMSSTFIGLCCFYVSSYTHPNFDVG